MLQDYDCSQEYYEKEKENFIKAYSDYPITLLDRSGMSEEERIAHRNEKLKAEWEAELKKSPKNKIPKYCRHFVDVKNGKP